MSTTRIPWTLAGALLLVLPALAQTAQRGADLTEQSARLRVEYVSYRAAKWETEHVAEVENGRPNKGGLVHVYMTNVSDEPLRLQYYRVNDEDESYWRLNGFLAWDRLWQDTLEPGATTVQEINAIDVAFAVDSPFNFTYVGGDWEPVGSYETTLCEDPVQISYMCVLPGRQKLLVHVRHTGEGRAALDAPKVLNHGVEGSTLYGAIMDGPSQAILELDLTEPLASGELFFVKLPVKIGDEVRHVYSHRRAFDDWFPIGTWSNNSKTYATLARLHIDLMVHGGRPEDSFFSEIAPKYGFKAMVPFGNHVNAEQIRALADNPATACWLLDDEPDWKREATIINFLDEGVRQVNSTRPTFLTLCRNVKFFEYASIADIPCMDHYTVTAPTSSIWALPPYGTYLEETGYYTRDLKAASEPKPIWIWSQALADWSERPARPVPSPEELAVQLALNIGRGAKGIIWFNHDAEVAARFPEVEQAMQGWGRVMLSLRDIVLRSEPGTLDVTAPDKVDVAPLIAPDSLVLVISNLDYELSQTAYPFRDHAGVKVHVETPAWIQPAGAVLVAPDGVSDVEMTLGQGSATLTVPRLHDAAFVVLYSGPETRTVIAERFAQALAAEEPPA